MTKEEENQGGMGWESEIFFRMNNKENVYICNTGLKKQNGLGEWTRS